MEAQILTFERSKHKGSVVVGPDAGALIGMSGREVAVLAAGTEVTTHGEQGPYTIVSSGGRLGYVLTSCLMLSEELEALAAEVDRQATDETEGGRRTSGSWTRVFLPWRRQVA